MEDDQQKNSAPGDSEIQSSGAESIPQKQSFIQRIRSHKYTDVAVVSIGIVLLSGAFFVLGRASKEATDTATNQQEVVEKQEPTPEEVNNSAPEETKQGISWLGELQPYPYQTVFSDQALAEFYYLEAVPVDPVGLAQLRENVSFFKVGADNNKDILVMKVVGNGLGVPNFSIVIKDGSSYQIIKNNSLDAFSADGSFYGPQISDSVNINDTATYFDIELRDQIAYNDTVIERTGSWRELSGDQLKGLTEVAKIDAGTVYERVNSIDGQDGIKQFSIYLKQPSGTYVGYRYTTPILKDDNSVQINWNDGKVSNEAYQWSMVWAGCGSVNSVNVLDKKYFNDLVEVGKSGSESIFRLNKVSHPALKTVYDAYAGFREDAVSIEDFYNDNGMIVVRNKLGYRVVLVKDKYQRAAECAKPVIYLYPQKPVAIDVSVGADVRVSDPQYGVNGWQQVLAYPNGRLAYQGSLYESLFWDGVGHGDYPEVTSGFVVPRSNLESVLRDHLARLGMNEKESDDFMEYWMPLMPDTPFVRLSWFGTQQMNQLAPLYLSETPDTLIRIFLDFQGLEQPINLQPQELSHPPREGFVVVEWGGLRLH